MESQAFGPWVQNSSLRRTKPRARAQDIHDKPQIQAEQTGIEYWGSAILKALLQGESLLLFSSV
jgi:hypothetical protein